MSRKGDTESAVGQCLERLAAVLEKQQEAINVLTEQRGQQQQLIAEDTERAMIWSNAQDGGVRPIASNIVPTRQHATTAYNGHWRNGQPSEPRRCFHCHEVGHTARDCQKLRAENTRNGLHTSKTESNDKTRHGQINSLRAGTGANLMYLPIKVCGEDTMALIDPGSTDNFIDEHFAEKVQADTLTLAEGDQLSITMGDTTSRTISKLAHGIPVTHDAIQDEPQERLDCMIMPLGTHGVILGMPWLRKRDAEINFNSNTISFDYGSQRVTLHTKTDGSTTEAYPGPRRIPRARRSRRFFSQG